MVRCGGWGRPLALASEKLEQEDTTVQARAIHAAGLYFKTNYKSTEGKGVQKTDS